MACSGCKDILPFAKYAKNRVTIQQYAQTSTPTGGQAGGWSDIGTVWAWAKPMTVNEKNRAGAPNSEVTHHIIIRYDSAYADTTTAAAYRLLLDGRAHNIHGVDLLDRDGKNYGKSFVKFVTAQGEPENE